jgi:hypothetical protein
VVVVGNDDVAAELYRAAVRPLGLNTAVLRLDADKAVAQNLPPALAETIPNLPALGEGRSFAVVCSGFTCQPPIFDARELARFLPWSTDFDALTVVVRTDMALARYAVWPA